MMHYAGHALAQKELAGLGLYGTLVTNESTVTNISYHDNLNNAMMWLRKAAQNGNIECSIAIKAINKYGTNVIINARKAVNEYFKSYCSSKSSKSVADFILFEIAVQYIDPWGYNEENNLKIIG